MKKIFVKCGLNHNLGDDLFLYIIAKRYEHQAGITCITHSRDYRDERNVHFFYCPNLLYRLANKIAGVLKHGNVFDKYFIKRSNIYLILGGSIFMENVFTSNYLKVMYYFKKNRVILGSNIGPYYNDAYLELIKCIFRNSKDVCLRDKKSYQLVKDVKTVRQAPDMIFALDIKKYKNTKQKRVIFSIINYEKKSKQFNSVFENSIYYENIVTLVQKYSKKYEIAFMSFCENEGDIEAIDIIKTMLPKKICEKVIVYNYNGNIEEALNFLANSEIIVGSRFHANILGFLLEKKVVPVIYNDKTRNLLKDINFQNCYIDLNDNKKVELEELDKVYKYPDLNKYIEKAEQHFNVLDMMVCERSEHFDRN